MYYNIYTPGGISVTSDDDFYFEWVDQEYLPVDFLSFGTEDVIGYWYINRAAGSSLLKIATENA